MTNSWRENCSSKNVSEQGRGSENQDKSKKRDEKRLTLFTILGHMQYAIYSIQNNVYTSRHETMK